MREPDDDEDPQPLTDPFNGWDDNPEDADTNPGRMTMNRITTDDKNTRRKII